MKIPDEWFVEWKSSNGKVEWHRSIPEEDEEITEETIKREDPEFRPQRTLDDT